MGIAEYRQRRDAEHEMEVAVVADSYERLVRRKASAHSTIGVLTIIQTIEAHTQGLADTSRTLTWISKIVGELGSTELLDDTRRAAAPPEEDARRKLIHVMHDGFVDVSIGLLSSNESAITEKGWGLLEDHDRSVLAET